MPWDRNQMAARAAQELEDGMYVNLGIGIPTLVPNYHPRGCGSSRCNRKTACWAWGLSPRGREDPDLINAGKQTITELPRRHISILRPPLA
jgi:3-oxoacid CoA-transferase subunit B